MLLLLLCGAAALPAVRLRGGSSQSTAVRLRGGSSQPTRWVTPQQDAWAKHRSAARSIVPSSGTSQLRPESIDDVVDAKPLDELLDRDSRVVFVRRVYGLLTANLALTARPLGRVLFGVCAAVGFVIPLALSFAPSLRRDPSSSLALFSLFAFAESAVVGVAASAYKLQSVLLALLQTGAATGALTAYAFQPNAKYDLTQVGSALLAGLMVLTVSTVAGVLLKVPMNSLAGSTVGALLFSAFIVHDTQLVVGGKKRQLNTSDYVLGAITLYLDIINLFFYLLRLFGEMQND
ncbi:hypothetical protein JL722_7486 [Aureococcus anophagefferens]|nr:hypothetical protein JL722_7486 [Aureococcus anophagefferens]